MLEILRMIPEEIYTVLAKLADQKVEKQLAYSEYTDKTRFEMLLSATSGM